MSRPDKLPHIQSFTGQPLVFLTVVTHQRNPALTQQHAFDCLTEIWLASPSIDGWFVGDYLLMPDHAHLFARATPNAKPLSQWVQTWKSLSSRRLLKTQPGSARFWQPDYFDHFMRSAESFAEKRCYVAMNPVRKNLCATPDDWPWKGTLTDLRF